MQRAHDEIDRDAARIVEGQEGLDLASCRLFRAAGSDLVAIVGKRVCRSLQRLRITHFEANGVAGPGVLGEHQRVIAKIRAERGLGVVLLDEFEPKDALSEMSRRSKVAGAEPDIAELFYCYHVHLPGGSRLVEPVWL